MGFIGKVRNYIFYHAVYAGLFNSWDDERFIRLLFRRSLGYEPDLENPKTFNEKMQWLKLHDRKPEYTAMVDKYEAKQIIAEKLGEQYVIPTLGVWDRVEDIDFDSLPTQFVLKTTHDCGGVVICRDKASFDVAAAKKKLAEHMKVNYYYTSREWPYKDVKPRIIAEQYMEDESSAFLPVYKIFCFGGKPVLIQANTNDKQADESIDYFDTDWNRLDLRRYKPNSAVPPKKPEALDEMLSLSRRLSADFRFLRTDFYCINGSVCFSEFTFFSVAGFASFSPPEWDRKLGDLIQLPTTQ